MTPEMFIRHAASRLRPALEHPEMALAALRRRYPRVTIGGSLETFLEAAWRERWKPRGTRHVITRDVIVQAHTPQELADKLARPRRPGWKPPGAG